MNITALKPSLTLSAILHCAAANQPLFIWGPPGVGKSSIVKQAAEKLGRTFIDLRLSTTTPADLSLPVPDLEARITNWFAANILPKASDGPTLLLLDELPSAPPAVQVQAYQLVLDRKIGDYKLPEDVIIIAAGNRLSDRAVSYKQSSALTSRFTHIEIDLDLDDWCRWALKVKIAHEVIAFVRFKPDMLFDFDSSQDGPFPCPRAWEGTSKLLKAAEDPTDFITSALVTGTVGMAASAEFMGFLRVYKSLPNLDQIIIAPNKAPVPTDPAALFAVTTGLSAKATPENFGSIITYLDRLPEEFNQVCVKMAAERNDDICSTKAFTNWSVNHQAAA